MQLSTRFLSSQEASQRGRKITSQLSLNDFPNIELLDFLEDYNNETYDNLATMTCQSTLICRDISRQIVFKANQIIYNRYIENQLPPYTIFWLQFKIVQQLEVINIDCDTMMVDVQNQGVGEDDEPRPVDIEHWRRFQGQVNMKQYTEPSQCKESKRSSTISQFSRKKSDRFDAQPIKMGEFEDDQNYDPDVESMRQAKIRQIQIQQQKEINDKVKQLEVQEQVKQLKRLNIDSKSMYTFDYEGKVVIQKPPDVDKYPKFIQNINEKRSQLEVKDLYPQHKSGSESIYNSRRTMLQQNQNQFTQRNYVPIIEQIILKEGVSMLEGKNEKRNDRNLELMDVKDQSELSQKLLSTKMRMTKMEYQQITNQSLTTFQFHKGNQSTQMFKSANQTQQHQKSSMSDIQQELNMPNESSLISKNQNLQTINNSLSDLRLNGSISIKSDLNMIEDLIVDTTQPIILIEAQKSQQSLQLPPPPSPKVSLPQISDQPLRNSKSKLPNKILTSPGTLPKLLPKYPRERIIKKAIMIKKDNTKKKAIKIKKDENKKEAI